MGNEPKPTDPKPGAGAKDKDGSPLDKALGFLNNPEFGKGLRDIQEKLSDEGLSQADKEKLVADLKERDKKRDAELQELKKKLEANQASLKNDQEALKKSQDVAAKLQKEINDIAARRKANQAGIAKSLGDADAAHDKTAKLEEDLKKMRDEN